MNSLKPGMPWEHEIKERIEAAESESIRLLGRLMDMEHDAAASPELKAICMTARLLSARIEIAAGNLERALRRRDA